MSTPSIYAEPTSSRAAAPPSAPAAPPGLQGDVSRTLLGLLTLWEKSLSDAHIAHPDDLLKGVIPRQTLRMLLSALRFRDAATMRHCRRVATLAVGLAKSLGWDRSDQKILEAACLLHDIGKIGVPDNILFKPGRLSAEESKLMALHWHVGIAVLQACRADHRVVEFISQASLQLVADDDDVTATLPQVHQGARILAVADAYDSLSHDQVFRESRSHDEVLEMLMKSSGRRFDGNVVCALARWVEQEEQSPSTDSEESEEPPRPASDSQEALEAGLLQQMFSSLYSIESKDDGFYLLDSDMRFVVWSPGVAKLLRRPGSAVVGEIWKPGFLGYAGEMGQPLTDGEVPLQLVMQSRQQRTTTLKVRQAEDSWSDLEVRTLPLIDEHGRFHGIAEILKDLKLQHTLPPDYRELKLAASRDALTAVANRGELETQLNLLLDQWRDDETAEPFSVIFLDIDFFKNINDTFGHSVGDQVLVDVARLMQNESYSGELVGRYGGEEFVILCPATRMEQAVRRAERVRAAVSDAKIGGIANYRVTASFGVTQVERKDTAETVLQRADKALYMAKESGRNKTCSLTSEQAAVCESQPRDDDAPEGFVFQTTFQACLAADMIVYKLGGYVRDENVKLGEVTPNRVELRVGSAGLFRRWGSSAGRQPVRVVLEFGSLKGNTPGRRAAAQHVQVKVTVKPIGAVRYSSVFQSRARHVVKDLRCYLQAE